MATETFIIDIRTRGTKKSAADVKRIGQSADRVRKTLAFLRNALVAVAAIRVFAKLTGDLVAFSDEMLVVKAVTAATTQEFARLKETAQGLGATTRFTAAEAASGMAFLARAGFEVNEVMSAIPATLDLAAAAQLDLGNAADIASNLMTSFGLSVKELPDVIDTLVFTANNANTNVQQLADGLKLFAPLASQFGISIEQAASAMGVLGDSGIQASLAGTGLRRIITDLEAPTGALAKVLKIAEVSLDDIRPSANDLSDILDTLTEANIGASAASLAFGKRGGFVFAALQRQRKAFRELTAEQEKNTGIAKENARILEEGLGGALRLVRSAAQNLFLAFADLGAEESLNQFFRSLAEGLRIVARNADDVVKAMKFLIAAFVISKVISFSAAIAGTTINLARYVIGTAAAAFSTETLAVRLKGLGLAMLALPFVAILTTLALLTAGLVVFQDEIKLTDDGTVTLADTFTALENTVGKSLLDAINALGFDFESFGDIAEDIAMRVGLGFTRLVANLNGVVEVIKAVFNEFPKFFSNIGSEIQRLFFTKLEEGLNGLVRGLNFLFSVFDSEIQFELFDLGTLIPEATSLGVDLKTAFNKGFDAVGTELFKAADVRRAAELDAAILATENANRRAAQKRLPGKEPPPAFLGDQFDISGGGNKAAKEIESLTDSLRQLEAAHFPLLAVREATRDVLKTINEAEAKGIKLRVEKDELIRRSIRDQIGANKTLEEAGEVQDVLNNALRRGIILQEEFEFLSRKAAISFLDSQRDAASGAQRAFLKLTQDATDAAAFTEMVFTDAFKSIEDAVVDFATTGTFSVNDFFRNFGEQLLRLGTQQAIAGIGQGFSGALGGLGGGGGSGAGTGGFNIGGFLSGLLPFHNGGAFKVGSDTGVQSLPGIDNRLVAFRAQDGEEVTVTPKGEGVGAIGPTNIVFNVQARDADSFNRSQSQLQNRLLAGIGQARRRR